MLLTRNRRLRLIWGAVETFNLLALRLLWKNPANARAYAGRVFREYMSLVQKDQWQCRPIEDVLPAITDRRIVLEHSPGDGLATPLEELAILALLTRNTNPRLVFEIGTYRGRTALNFALNSPSDCRILTLDLPRADRTDALAGRHDADVALIRGSDPGLYWNGHAEAAKIAQLYGDSTRFDFSPYTGQADIVFIDGAHDYATVASDTRNALNMVRPGGWILWHDFANYGDYNDVTRAVLDLLPPQEISQLGATQLAAYRKP